MRFREFRRLKRKQKSAHVASASDNKPLKPLSEEGQQAIHIGKAYEAAVFGLKKLGLSEKEMEVGKMRLRSAAVRKIEEIM